MKSLKDYIINFIPVYNSKTINKFLDENHYDKYLSFEEFIDTVDIDNFDYPIIEEHFYNKLYTKIIPNDNYNNVQTILNENLGKSIELTNNTIEKILSAYSDNITSIDVDNEYQMTLYVNDKFNIKDKKFISILNFFNYYIQYNKNNKVQIEARKPKQIEYSCKYCYHITTNKKYSKIQKVGLCPHKVKDDFPYRTYMFMPDNNIDKIINSFKLVNTKISDANCVILKIDIASYNEDKPSKLVLYGDPSYNIDSAVFTLENIPAKYISKVVNINESKGEDIDEQWLNDEKPVMTHDGRQVIITKIDYEEIPNIIHGQVKMKEKLFDYEWHDDGMCIKALDQMGNPKKPDEADKLVKGA